MQRLKGQINLGNLLTTLLAAVILAVGGFVWNKISTADSQFTAIDKRLTRIEDALERFAPAKKK